MPRTAAHRTHAQHLASKLNLRPRPVLVRTPEERAEANAKLPRLGAPQTNDSSTSTSPLLVNKQGE